MLCRLAAPFTFACVFTAALPYCASAQPAVYAKQYDFASTSSSGAPPVVSQPVGAPLLLPSGNFYGVSYFGGPNACTASSSQCGTFFELTPPASAGAAWTETTLYRFQAGVDGTAANANPLYINGVFYGTTYGGGSPTVNEGNGTVYSMTVNRGGKAATKKTLYTFQGGTDGSRPTFLTLLNNNIYGITNFGGSANAGIVYELAPSSPGGPLTETIIHTFDGADEGSYAQYMVAYNGELYVSVCYNGMYEGGTIVKLTPPTGGSTTWTSTVIFSFGGSASLAWNPEGISFGPDGNLYGALQLGGGTTTCHYRYSGCGAIFQLKPAASGNTWDYTQIYTFQGGADSGSPYAPPTFDSEGTIWVSSTGTQVVPTSYGAILRLTPSNGAFNKTIVHTFSPSDATDPAGMLTFGPTGVMYGFATYGGSTNSGAFFSLTPKQ